MPFISSTSSKAKKSKDGGSATWFFDRILALKGGNTQEFWCYNTATDSWRELDTMPRVAYTNKKKRVNRGADIIHIGETSLIYALKGNRTLEFWQYQERDADRIRRLEAPSEGRVVTDLAPHAQPLCVSSTVTASGSLRLLGPAQWTSPVTVRDVTGRVVRRSWVRTGWLDLSDLGAGVYFVRVESQGRCSVRRIELVR
jgi:hypothetical protein